MTTEKTKPFYTITRSKKVIVEKVRRRRSFLDRRNPEEVYASVKTAWANSPGMVAAWADAPPVVRERFITEVLLNSATTTPALNATIGKTFKRASRDGLLRRKVGDK